MDDTKKEMDQIKTQKDEMFAKHEFMCNFWGVDKNDEMRTKSDDFFKMFTDFLKQIVKALPKEEKKRPGAAKKQGYGQGGMNPMMAEMMARQAKEGKILK